MTEKESPLLILIAKSGPSRSKKIKTRLARLTTKLSDEEIYIFKSTVWRRLAEKNLNGHWNMMVEYWTRVSTTFSKWQNSCIAIILRLL